MKSRNEGQMEQAHSRYPERQMDSLWTNQTLWGPPPGGDGRNVNKAAGYSGGQEYEVGGPEGIGRQMDV